MRRLGSIVKGTCCGARSTLLVDLLHQKSCALLPTVLEKEIGCCQPSGCIGDTVVVGCYLRYLLKRSSCRLTAHCCEWRGRYCCCCLGNYRHLGGRCCLGNYRHCLLLCGWLCGSDCCLRQTCHRHNGLEADATLDRAVCLTKPYERQIVAIKNSGKTTRLAIRKCVNCCCCLIQLSKSHYSNRRERL